MSYPVIHQALSAGVQINKGIKADKDLIDGQNPDAVILATGGKPITPPIPGIDKKHVVQAWDALSGNTDLGKNVVVIGGGAVGIKTGVHISKIGTIDAHTLQFLFLRNAEDIDTLRDLSTRGIKKVTIIEMLPRLGNDIGMSTRWVELQMLKIYDVKSMTDTKVVEITHEGVIVESNSGQEHIPCDSVVVAAGTSSDNSLEAELSGSPYHTFLIGDADRPRKAYEAIREGFETAISIA